MADKFYATLQSTFDELSGLEFDLRSIIESFMTSDVAVISAIGHGNHSIILSEESGLTIPYNLITSSMIDPTTTWQLFKFVKVAAGAPHSWFLVNAEQMGLYRVNYDERNWRALISALDKNPEVFSSATKAQLIDDSFNLARVGLMSYDTAFDLFMAVAQAETSYSVWNAVARNLMDLSFLLRPTTVFEGFKVSFELFYFLKILMPEF